MNDRVLFPETGFTKSDAVDYYRRVAKFLLPHLRNRPVSLKHYPDTIGGESDIDFIVINDVRTLVWVAEIGGIEIHPFLHRLPKLDEATHVVFDLDPGTGASIVECCEVALLLRDALHALKLESFAKVSGSKGLQVYVPLNSGATHDATETFARLVAETLAKANPKLIVAKMTKSVRAKKVFIDWSQNADYKTTVSVYSLRAKRETPYVSMPVTWDEVKKAKNLDFEPEEALARLRKRGDIWARMESMKQRLSSPRSSALASRSVRLANRGPRPDDRGPNLPKPKSQSGRRLFVLVKGDAGDELWLDMHGKFKRWILRADREQKKRLIAMPAGDFKIDPAYFRGEVPAQWRKRIKIEDIGAYELIEGSYPQRRFDLWFSGKALAGEWELEKIAKGEEHRSWQLKPAS